MKKLVFIAMIACALVFAGTTAAFANFGPHGGYAADTDACASCHRAHTATSGLTWKDGQGEQKNALLISDAITTTDFCYACHGDGAPGAGTNVESGVFDAAPTGTNSVQGETLNGGGFTTIGGEALAGGKTVMSSHGVQALDASTFIRWGYVSGTGSDLTAMTSFTCTDCHDPHGSSNYRLLKDVVNGVTVGGYVGTNNTPAPYVISNEEGYPSGGWAKGDAGAAQMAVYKPSYTSAQYAKTAPGKSMSAWCAACHTVYAESDSEYDYAGKIGGPKGLTSTMYHRHPIDVPLSVGTSPNAEDRSLITQLLDNKDLPLEMGSGLLAPGTTHTDTKIWDDRGNVSCLTCHRAHGTEATMEGWAASPLGTDGLPVLANPQVKNGVDPTFDAALLRMDNRGVCEACHNK